MSRTPSGPPGTDSDDDERVAAFEELDWEEAERGGRFPPAERLALLVGVAVVAITYVYYRLYRRTYLVASWNVGPEDWLLMLAAAFVVAYGIVPLVRNPDRTRRLAGRLRRRVPVVVALLFLAVVFVVAVWALVRGFEPNLWSPDEDWEIARHHPPVGFATDYEVVDYQCVGEVTGSPPEGRECHGIWRHPLGTDNWGYDMIDLLVVGARPFAYLSIVTVGVIVPLATAVGMAAGYYGGRVDDVLSTYLDVQLSVPALLVYVLAYLIFFDSMFVFLVAFGLLAWGGVARIVRSETLQQREEGYVLSARAVGASDRYVLRRHLFPNVSNAVVPATFHLLAILVLTEAGVAFVGFHPSFQSWGMTISEGLFYGDVRAWWNSLLPAVALGLVVVALKVAGDGFRDVLDPRREP